MPPTYRNSVIHERRSGIKRTESEDRKEYHRPAGSGISTLNTCWRSRFWMVLSSWKLQACKLLWGDKRQGMLRFTCCPKPCRGAAGRGMDHEVACGWSGPLSYTVRCTTLCVTVSHPCTVQPSGSGTGSVAARRVSCASSRATIAHAWSACRSPPSPPCPTLLQPSPSAAPPAYWYT